MTPGSLVSIVIPHFNRATLLAQTLQSVKLQDYENWEVLVVDDGSVDTHWTTTQQLATERVHILKRTDGIKGPSRCRNLGGAAAKGEYLLFLDSDDTLAPWCLSQRMALVEEEPQEDLWVFPVMLFKRQPGDLSVCWNRLEGDDDLERFLRSDPPWHTSSPLWRKEAFEAVGGFNEKVMYGDDAELHVRTLLKGISCKKYPHSLPDVFIRRGQEDRITNTCLPSLLASRQVRLAEGTRLLRELGADQRLLDLWEGQYFVECEERLFSMDDAGQHIAEVVHAWVRNFSPPCWRRWIVRWYFRLGSLCRARAYWLLRIARRLAMMALPGGYFPSGGSFQSWNISADTASAIHKKLNFDLGETPQS